MCLIICLITDGDTMSFTGPWIDYSTRSGQDPFRWPVTLLLRRFNGYNKQQRRTLHQRTFQSLSNTYSHTKKIRRLTFELIEFVLFGEQKDSNLKFTHSISIPCNNIIINISFVTTVSLPIKFNKHHFFGCFFKI